MKLNDLTVTAAHERLGALVNKLRRSLVEELRNDTEAECRWWNGLAVRERLAFVGGAKRPAECAVSDWLDIGETSRTEILNAAHAVQCWLSSFSRP